MIFKVRKDGGPESNATGYWLCEFKSLFSIVLMKFEGKSREAYHSHAFNSWNWILSGELRETLRIHLGDYILNTYTPSIKPIYISRDMMHKVSSDGVSWVLSFRGPWSKTWKEIRDNKEYTLTNGRVEI